MEMIGGLSDAKRKIVEAAGWRFVEKINSYPSCMKCHQWVDMGGNAWRSPNGRYYHTDCFIMLRRIRSMLKKEGYWMHVTRHEEWRNKAAKGE